jgi:hypothetical protein
LRKGKRAHPSNGPARVTNADTEAPAKDAIEAAMSEVRMVIYGLLISFVVRGLVVVVVVKERELIYVPHWLRAVPSGFGRSDLCLETGPKT